MSIAIVLGTRPEIIKISPVIRECQKRGLDHFVLHTGQHYSHLMDGVFLEDLELPKPLDMTLKLLAGQFWTTKVTKLLPKI
jgi:UDP-N-acetylglucosamine 2-epimerase